MPLEKPEPRDDGQPQPKASILNDYAVRHEALDGHGWPLSEEIRRLCDYATKGLRGQPLRIKDFNISLFPPDGKISWKNTKAAVY